MSDDSKPVSKEVSIDAVDAINSFVDLVGKLSGLDTVLEIENKLAVPLTRVAIVDGFHPSTGSHGSGQFPNEAPVKTVDPGMEGLTAVESAGAGAIALVIYQVGASEIFIVFYTARPKVGHDVGCAAIFNGPHFSEQSHEWWQDRANLIMADMNQLSHRTSNVIKAAGLEVEYTITGSSPQVANFVVRDRTDGRSSFKIVHNKTRKPMGGAPEPALNSKEYSAIGIPSSQVTCLDQTISLTDPILWEWDYSGDKPDFDNVRIVTSGQDDQFYLNYRGIGGRVKLYDDIDTSHWRVTGRDPNNNKIQFYSVDHEEWMRVDDEDRCYVDVDDESDLDSSWTLVNIRYH